MPEQTEQQWIEWGVRRTWGDIGSIAHFERDYRTARKCAKDWPGVLVHRVVTAADWMDGEPVRAPSPEPMTAAPLPEEKVAALAWRIANVACIHTSGVDPSAITGCRECEDIAEEVAPLVAGWLAEAGCELQRTGDGSHGPLIRQAKAEALRDFARKWADWIAQDAPQIRGGAAYRAVCEAQAIEAATESEPR